MKVVPEKPDSRSCENRREECLRLSSSQIIRDGDTQGCYCGNSGGRPSIIR